jgi:hypothetical protein
MSGRRPSAVSYLDRPPGLDRPLLVITSGGYKVERQQRVEFDTTRGQKGPWAARRPSGLRSAADLREPPRWVSDRRAFDIRGDDPAAYA